jgi:hypothetical protein
MANQVGEKDECAFKDADEDKIAVPVIVGNFSRDFGDESVDLLFLKNRYKFRHKLWGRHR